MRRSILALLATLPLLGGCNLRNAEGLATAGVAVAGVTALAFTANQLVDSAAQRDLQRRQFDEMRESRLFQQDEQRAQRLSSEDFQREQLEIQKNQLRPRR